MPTYRDLCERFGWRSTGTARDHLRALARKGYVELSGGRARKLHLMGERPAAVSLPVVGQIIAGAPLLSVENVDATTTVPAYWLSQGTHFVLRVMGDSMRDAGILEGDYVVVRKQQVANEGDIVVAVLEGQTTLKRLGIVKGSLLAADNPNYAPIVVRTVSSTIQGVVVGLLREYASKIKSPKRQMKKNVSLIARGGDL